MNNTYEFLSTYSDESFQPITLDRQSKEFQQNNFAPAYELCTVANLFALIKACDEVIKASDEALLKHRYDEAMKAVK